MKTLIIAAFLVSTSQFVFANETSLTYDAPRYQILESNVGSLRVFYKIDSQTGNTWVLMPGTTDGFVPVKTKKLLQQPQEPIVKEMTAEEKLNAHCAEEFLKATDSFVSDECQ